MSSRRRGERPSGGVAVPARARRGARAADGASISVADVDFRTLGWGAGGAAIVPAGFDFADRNFGAAAVFFDKICSET